MANGADGSIIIDTGLDNTGFERGSQRMQQAIRGVTQAINQSGRAAANGMQPLFSACQQAGSSINAAAQSAELTAVQRGIFIRFRKEHERGRTFLYVAGQSAPTSC